MSDVVAARVMRTIQLDGLRVHDSDLAKKLLRTYEEHGRSGSVISHHESMIPSPWGSWWGSREQVVFLQVLSAMLQLVDDSDTTRSLRESYIPSVTIVIDCEENNYLDSKVSEAVLKAVLFCPGPPDDRSMRSIASNRHDDLSLVAVCVLVCAGWCKDHHSRIKSLPERVNAQMCGRLCVAQRRCCLPWSRRPPSIDDLRRDLSES